MSHLGLTISKRAARFYDQLLAEIGAKRFMETETFIAWGHFPSGTSPVSDQARRTGMLPPSVTA